MNILETASDGFEEYSALGCKGEYWQYRRLLLRAEKIVSVKTFGRSDNPPEEMKENVISCIKEIAIVLGREAEVPKGVSSESNDGVSVSYSSQESLSAEMRREINALCCMYLTLPQNLMYAGGD